MSLEQAEMMLARSEALSNESIMMHREAMRLAQIHYGLESGVTVLRSQGKVGVFCSVLNWFSGKMLWVSVRLLLPEEVRGRGCNFYQAWEVFDPEEGKRLIEEERIAYEKALAERLRQRGLA